MAKLKRYEPRLTRTWPARTSQVASPIEVRSAFPLRSIGWERAPSRTAHIPRIVGGGAHRVDFDSAEQSETRDVREEGAVAGPVPGQAVVQEIAVPVGLELRAALRVRAVRRGDAARRRLEDIPRD